jgi:hypothetical protein
VAVTVVGQIKRQEPGHHAFYTMSARGLAAQLAPWQRWLVRKLRALSFSPVGANNDGQKADFGDLMTSLGIDRDVDGFALQLARVELELLAARGDGLKVPTYVTDAYREALALARERQVPRDPDEAPPG